VTERKRIFVTVSVQADFVARFGHHLAGRRKALNGVSWYEERLLDAKALEQPDEARHTDISGKYAARYVPGGVLSTIRAQPASHRIAMNRECAQDFLCHLRSLTRIGQWMDDGRLHRHWTTPASFASGVQMALTKRSTTA